jgi:hypothetical protein
MITQQVVFRYPEDLRAWLPLYPESTPTGRAMAGFREFSDRYSEYFAKIEVDRTKTTAARLNAQVGQALTDYWAPLGEVATQRRVAHYRDLLDDGTLQAQEYLDELGLGLPGVLIYFNKVATIKYCPYTRFAFIGTPYTQSVARDWMAIPHELGHYLYWNLGSTLSETRQRHQEIRKGAAAALQQVPELKQFNSKESEAAETMLLSWLEETFCDVVGTRLSGVKFIESLQTLITSAAGNVDDLMENDGRHPPLLMRPFVREHAHKLTWGTSRVDWDSFFKTTFQLEGVQSLKLAVFPQITKSAIARMLKKTLVELLAAEESTMEAVIPAFQLPLPQIVPAIEALVEFLNAQIDDLLKAPLPTPTEPGSAFDQLLALAEEEAKVRGEHPYEILLRPRILEGGEWHGPHAAWAHGSWRHTIPAHPH